MTVTRKGSEIILTGVFAADSSAKGLFVVLQSEDDGSGDEFRAVLRKSQGDSGITVPPSTYTLLVYDLEENALPNENMAFISSEKITMENGKKAVYREISQINSSQAGVYLHIHMYTSWPWFISYIYNTHVANV